jgi:hypothetical protein
VHGVEFLAHDGFFLGEWWVGVCIERERGDEERGYDRGSGDGEGCTVGMESMIP